MHDSIWAPWRMDYIKSQSNHECFLCEALENKNDKEALMGLMAVQTFNPGVVLLARLRKTQKDEMKKITANQAIDVLFYD